jgi:hypothetical protein
MTTVPAIRMRACNAAPVRADGDFVLYWMIAFHRDTFLCWTKGKRHNGLRMAVVRNFHAEVIKGHSPGIRHDDCFAKRPERAISITLAEKAMPAEKWSLGKAVNGLKQVLSGDALDRPEAWVRRMGHALNTLEQSVRQHRATLSDDEGRVVEVDSSLNPSPGMARRVDELGKDLDNLLDEVQALRRKLNTVHPSAGVEDPSTASRSLPVAPDIGDGTDLSVFRERAEQLMEWVGNFSKEEAQLIEDSVTMDLGVGD